MGRKKTYSNPVAPTNANTHALTFRWGRFYFRPEGQHASEGKKIKSASEARRVCFLTLSKQDHEVILFGL
jgi:hypothetical protein